MSDSPAVRLAAYEETDLSLTLACERDPVAMRQHGGPIWEAGWMLLPSQHGRGIGTRALALIIELARERDLGEPHAFPGQDNMASNALCRSAGFELIGTDEGEFAGKPIVSNHWRLDLAGRGAG